MDTWNILITSLMGTERTVYAELKAIGGFKKASFKDVYIGQVEDLEAFMETLEKNIFLLPNVGKVIPIQKTFSFQPGAFDEMLKAALLEYLPQLEGKSFFVRIERRGFKGKINSLTEEQTLDQFLLDQLRQKGKEGKIDFKDPDYIIVVETLGDRCGVGLIAREMKKRHPVVRIH